MSVNIASSSSALWVHAWEASLSEHLTRGFEAAFMP